MTAGARRMLWVDATAGVSGDMLLAALVDAGARSDVVASAVAAVAAEVRLAWSQVIRAGLAARRVDVGTVGPSPGRSLAQLVAAIEGADLPEGVGGRAVAVVVRLATAEARVHGVPVEQVHLHEVGAWDSIADIVGVCAAVHDLGVHDLLVSPVAVGSGRIRAEHGDLPVPAPGVGALLTGWQVLAGGAGELATPTGAALVTTLATGQGPLPAGRLAAVGVGAGARDVPDRANVVRVLLLDGPEGARTEDLVDLAANVDDLDPRAWPAVLQALLLAGAVDAWIVPVVMKKGRPAHVVHALGRPDREPVLVDVLLRHTTTLGVRASTVRRTSLDRRYETVEVAGHGVRMKVAVQGEQVLRAVPEYDDAAAAAAATGRPVHEILTAAAAAFASRRRGG